MRDVTAGGGGHDPSGEVPSASGIRGRRDLMFKSFERIFRIRVPLSPAAMAMITVTDPWSYAELGEAVEAWGFRWMQDKGEFRSSTGCGGRPGDHDGTWPFPHLFSWHC